MLFADMFAQTGKDIGEILHDLGEEKVEKRWNEENRIRQERTIDMGKLIEIADAAVEEKNAAMQRGVDTLICGGIGGGAQMALAEAGIKLYGGVSGEADAAVNALLASALAYDPNVRCDHHDHAHGEGGHTCGEHGCGHHGCH